VAVPVGPLLTLELNVGAVPRIAGPPGMRIRVSRPFLSVVCAGSSHTRRHAPPRKARPATFPPSRLGRPPPTRGNEVAPPSESFQRGSRCAPRGGSGDAQLRGRLSPGPCGIRRRAFLIMVWPRGVPVFGPGARPSPKLPSARGKLPPRLGVRLRTTSNHEPVARDGYVADACGEPEYTAGTLISSSNTAARSRTLFL
jgi:hypothetical protein